MASEDSPSKPSDSRSLLDRLFRKDPPSENGGAPDLESTDLVNQAAAFTSLRVADVMTPRADIVAVEIGCSLADLVALFIETEHSRLPIYRETLDDPVGLVHIKDVFKMTAGEANRPSPDEQVLRRLRRELLYVPLSMSAAALLAKMQASRQHMALVIDEFGGADGLVTLEDLIEAVVGEIDDEHDETSRALVLARGAGVYEADARASIEDLESLIGESMTPADLEEELDTVGGLVSALAGRVPQRGEVIAHPGGYDLEVLEADPRRVRRVRIRDMRPASDPPAT